MNDQETMARLKEMSLKKNSMGNSARLLLAIVERSDPAMKSRLLKQLSQSLLMVDEVTKNVNDPEFQRQLLAMRGRNRAN